MSDNPAYIFDTGLKRAIQENLSRFEPQDLEATARKRAAVAVVVTRDDDGLPCFLLTRRSTSLRGHSGQWALPGGRLDPGEDSSAGALRELSEELGLHLKRSDILGRLDDYPTRSGYLIRPIVVWCDGAGPITPNPAEVASVHHIPFATIDHADTPEFYEIPESDRPVVHIDIGVAQVHAPTAAILYQFREVALKGNPLRVAHFEQPVWAWR